MTFAHSSTIPGVASRPTSATGNWQEELLEQILHNPQIPSPPTLALQLFQKTGQENCSVQEISELLAHDPGLCGKILKTLNSAVYGRARPVTNVRQAVVLLGNRPLRSLVLGLTLPVMQAGLPADAGFRRFWKKSVAGAVMARELAACCQMPAPDDEMAVNLLCDLGMILLHHTFQDEYRPIWTGEAGITSEEQCDWEGHHLGVHHAAVSAALLERWQLPIEFVEPIRFHHDPRNMPPLVKHFADRALLLEFVTRLTDLEETSRNVVGMEEILHAARELYGFERVDLERFLASVRPKVEEFSRILGVDIGACPDFGELLATGCEELVRGSLEATTPTVLDQKPLEESTTVDQAANPNRVRELFNDPEKVRPGSRILQYKVVEFIGRGAMGIVIKAFDPKLSRHVAIKLLASELAGSEKARLRFALEARFAASLRHENIVAIHSVNELDGVPFLVMEYVKGASLDDLLETGTTFSVGDIARIARQTALGLAAAHEARLIHRDIKPANILLEEKTMHVRIADFGVARAIDEDFHLSQPGMLLGTPNYMSPEQVDGKPLTATSDLFSLGSVLYTLCTGHLPFQAETLSGLLHAVAEKIPVPISTLNPDIPPGLVHVVERLHEKNPLYRFASAADVAEALQPWCDWK